MLTGDGRRDAETTDVERCVSGESDVDSGEHVEAFIADVRGGCRSEFFEQGAFVISQCFSVRFRKGDGEVVGADPPALDVDVDVVVNGAKEATPDFKWTKS